MSAWSDAELDAVGDAEELHVATRRADDSLRNSRIVWVVRHASDLYVRSVNGPTAAWYRGVQVRHAGHISAGDVRTNVAFVDADHDLNDALDAIPPQVRPLRQPDRSNHCALARQTTCGFNPPERKHS